MFPENENDLYSIFIVSRTMGMSTEYQVKSNDTIKILKDKIQLIEDIPTEKQTIIYKSKILKDNQTMKQCGIHKNATLFLVFNNNFLW